jgi:hypothetical protein
MFREEDEEVDDRCRPNEESEDDDLSPRKDDDFDDDEVIIDIEKALTNGMSVCIDSAAIASISVSELYFFISFRRGKNRSKLCDTVT